MPRRLIGGVIQAAVPLTDPALPIERIRQAAIDIHIPLIEERRVGVECRFSGYRKCSTDLTSARRRIRFGTTSRNPCPGPPPRYFVDPRGNCLAVGSEDRTELVVAEMDLDVIEDVRRVWQFYRDRRPESYGPMSEQLP